MRNAMVVALRAKGVVMIVAACVALSGTLLGQRNESLYTAQKKLIEMGHDPGAPDGINGARTEAAIRDFQRDNKLPLTGKLDSATLRALLGAPTGQASAAGATHAVDFSKFGESTSALTQRKVETRARLSVRHFSEKSVWAFSLERSTDQLTHLSVLPFPSVGTSWKASVVSSEEPDSVVLRALPNATGVVAFERFDDVAYMLGVGSEVRFDSEEWVEFYGEHFRKGGLRISNDKVEFLEGTERQSVRQVLSLQRNSWIRTPAGPQVATVKALPSDGLTAEAFQENADWAKATAQGTASAYRAFLTAHPESHCVQVISGMASYRIAIGEAPPGVAPATSTQLVGPDAASASKVLLSIGTTVLEVDRATAETHGWVESLGGGMILKTKGPSHVTLYTKREGAILTVLAVDDGLGIQQNSGVEPNTRTGLPSCPTEALATVSREAAPALIACLKIKDWRARKVAATALLQLLGPSDAPIKSVDVAAFDPLLKVMRSEGDNVKPGEVAGLLYLADQGAERYGAQWAAGKGLLYLAIHAYLEEIAKDGQ